MSSADSSRIADGMVVGIYYTLKNTKGETLDSNRKGGPPLVYLHGKGQLVPGLERRLLGKGRGEQLRTEVPPEEGYGLRDDAAISKVPRRSFPSERPLEIGMQFQTQGPTGGVMVVRVAAIEGDEVTLDMNHPLAGETLCFEIDIAGVRAPTAEELTHGHAHGHGGHHHH